MYIVALILACFATTVLTETNAENDDSQVALQAANRALLNDLKAAKATNERQREALDAAKATNKLAIEASAAHVTQEARRTAGVTIGEVSAGLKQICIVATISQVATIKKKAEIVLKQGDKKAATKTATKKNSDPGAPARQIATKLSPVTAVHEPTPH